MGHDGNRHARHRRGGAPAQPLDDDRPAGTGLWHPHPASRRHARGARRDGTSRNPRRARHLHVPRIPEQPASHGRQLHPRRLVQDRRSRHAGKGRLHHLRRPRQGHAEGRRRERRSLRDRARHRAGAGRVRGRRRGAEAQDAGRGARGLCHRAPLRIRGRRRRASRAHPGPVSGEACRLQGAARGPHRPRHAALDAREDQQGRAEEDAPLRGLTARDRPEAAGGCAHASERP